MCVHKMKKAVRYCVCLFCVYLVFVRVCPCVPAFVWVLFVCVLCVHEMKKACALLCVFILCLLCVCVCVYVLCYVFLYVCS